MQHGVVRFFEDTKKFFARKVDKLLEGGELVFMNNADCELIKELGFPELPEIFKNYEGRELNFDLYLKIHYLSEIDFFDTEDNSNTFTDKDNFNILVQGTNIPQEWILSFMFKIGNIEGRRFLFEHFINDRYDIFKGFDKIDYQENHLDRIIGELSVDGTDNVVSSFELIQTQTTMIVKLHKEATAQK